MSIFDISIPELNNYFGSKWGGGMYQNIINLIPPHRNYYELFGGSLAVFRKKKPSRYSLINDLDRNVYEIYNKCYGNLGIDICNYPAAELLVTMKDLKEDSFIYLDPPYPLVTRRSIDEYKHEMSLKDHRDILELIVSMTAGVRIMISTYENELYSSMLEHWNTKEFSVMTRNGWRSEVVYYNYDSSRLHDYSYLGENFSERQRIRRKIKRHVTKLSMLPEFERNAIIESINNDYNTR